MIYLCLNRDFCVLKGGKALRSTAPAPLGYLIFPKYTHTHMGQHTHAHTRALHFKQRINFEKSMQNQNEISLLDSRPPFRQVREGGSIAGPHVRCPNTTPALPHSPSLASSSRLTELRTLSALGIVVVSGRCLAG